MRSIMPWWRNTERDKRRATSADKNVAGIKIQFAGLSNLTLSSLSQGFPHIMVI